MAAWRTARASKPGEDQWHGKADQHCAHNNNGHNARGIVAAPGLASLGVVLLFHGSLSCLSLTYRRYASVAGGFLFQPTGYPAPLFHSPISLLADDESSTSMFVVLHACAVIDHTAGNYGRCVVRACGNRPWSGEVSSFAIDRAAQHRVGRRASNGHGARHGRCAVYSGI